MKKVCIELMNGNKIIVELDEEAAPISVANFMHLVKTKFYDGIIFHRIIKGFMCQAGAYYLEGETLQQRVPNYTIPGEFTANGFENNIKHEPGVISMARTNEPNSASSQFFICEEAAPHLDDQYAAFGKVVEGFDYIKQLADTPTCTLAGSIADFPNPEAIDFDTVTIKTIYEVND